MAQKKFEFVWTTNGKKLNLVIYGVRLEDYDARLTLKNDSWTWHKEKHVWIKTPATAKSIETATEICNENIYNYLDKLLTENSDDCKEKIIEIFEIMEGTESFYGHKVEFNKFNNITLKKVIKRAFRISLYQDLKQYISKEYFKLLKSDSDDKFEKKIHSALNDLDELKKFFKESPREDGKQIFDKQDQKILISEGETVERVKKALEYTARKNSTSSKTFGKNEVFNILKNVL